MSTRQPMRCLIDDTALTRNLDEIENWVTKGLLVLVVPLYTLSRLNILKKDPSSLGVSARKAVKFLDHSTSSRGDLPHDPVILQGPDDQYPTWAEVEEHYLNESLKNAGLEEGTIAPSTVPAKQEKEGDLEADLPLKNNGGVGNTLSQMLLDKLNFAKDPAASSPTSTPPLSPSSSGPQSSKTSPEVKSATMLNQDKIPVPASLKPLLNPVVWYVHEKKMSADGDLVFLTNSADTMHLARDFGIPTKNIHQLRSSLEVEDVEVQVVEKSKKDSTKRLSAPEPKTLFSYDDVDSDEEEVVFKPRGRGITRGAQLSRSGGSGPIRNRGGSTQSPRHSFSTPVVTAQNKPQIPVEEIDPDSFDRGSFARGSTPLVNTSNHVPSPMNNNRPNYRGSFGRGGRGGSNVTRGYGGGFERGSTRGRGRLFVP